MLDRFVFSCQSAWLHLVGHAPSRVRRFLARGFLEHAMYKERSGLALLRPRALRFLGASIGDDVRIKSGVIIDFPERLIIGDRVSIQQRCFFSCYGGLTIGCDVSIAHDTSIVTSSHPTDATGKIREAPLISSPVVIGSNVWIGMKAMVLGGSLVGNNVVIGAGSLVNSKISDNSIAFGVPAKFRKPLVSGECR